MLNKPVQAAGEAMPNAKPTAEIEARDDIAKAKSMVLVCWLAMTSPNCMEDDHADVAETIYEAFERLACADRAFSAANEQAVARFTGRAVA